MSRLQITRPVVKRQVVIELPEDWEGVAVVDVTLTPHIKGAEETTSTTDTSALYQALDAAGFVGCIETDDQLSTTYKGRLDYSDKADSHR